LHPLKSAGFSYMSQGRILCAAPFLF